ncbi:MAG: class I SAM-dependent methyltransferase [Deltaproteobacteria bacterium]|nr:class I SAM-dependent methyltransferase [Deltaproteobacteria bacterium]
MTPPLSPRELYNKRTVIYEIGMGALRYFSTIEQFIQATEFSLSTPQPAILDLGCGAGTYVPWLQKKFPKAHITGFDYAKEMLALYHSRYPATPLLYGNYNDPSSFQTFPDHKPTMIAPHSFDLVISICSLSEYGNFDDVFAWINNILKPGGKFFAIGIRNNWFGKMSGLYWNFRPRSQAHFVNKAETHFSEVKTLPIAWKLFPMNVLKYAILCSK